MPHSIAINPYTLYLFDYYKVLLVISKKVFLIVEKTSYNWRKYFSALFRSSLLWKRRRICNDKRIWYFYFYFFSLFLIFLYFCLFFYLTIFFIVGFTPSFVDQTFSVVNFTTLNFSWSTPDKLPYLSSSILLLLFYYF